MNDTEVTLDKIVSLAKRRGFIYQGSEVYGGLAGTWDYGPLGVQLKKNIMDLWWKMFVENRDDMYGVDAAILMNQKTWKASGHVDTFTDPLTVCLSCNARQRIDKIIDVEEYRRYIDNVLPVFYEDFWNSYLERKDLFEKLRESNKELSDQVKKDNGEFKKLQAAKVDPYVYDEWFKEATERFNALKESQEIEKQTYDYSFLYLDLLEHINNKTREAREFLGDFAKSYLNTNAMCPVCHEKNWSTPQQFNMMFKTTVGPVADENSISYLRPETAQGIFTNYRNIIDSFSPDLPFGIAQQGKAFRNEISPRDFVFRSREFEQMEIEYFIHPDNWKEEFEKWRKNILEYFDALGLPKDKLHELEVPEDDLAHYSKRTIDFEFDYPHGKDELAGFAYRTDFDLSNVARESGKNMEYRPKDQSTPFVPHVIEPSFGVERAVMAVLVSAYREDEVDGEKRMYLALPEHLAPVKFAVSPLLKNKPELVKKAREVYATLKEKHGNVMWDDNGNIGKRYRRQDEIGTPKCVVIDFDTLEDDTVTVRDRDTMKQERVAVSNL